MQTKLIMNTIQTQEFIPLLIKLLMVQKIAPYLFKLKIILNNF